MLYPAYKYIFYSTLRELQSNSISFFYIKSQSYVEHVVCIHAIHYFTKIIESKLI